MFPGLSLCLAFRTLFTPVWITARVTGVVPNSDPCQIITPLVLVGLGLGVGEGLGLGAGLGLEAGLGLGAWL